MWISAHLVHGVRKGKKSVAQRKTMRVDNQNPLQSREFGRTVKILRIVQKKFGTKVRNVRILQSCKDVQPSLLAKDFACFFCIYVNFIRQNMWIFAIVLHLHVLHMGAAETGCKDPGNSCEKKSCNLSNEQNYNKNKQTKTKQKIKIYIT